MAAAGELGIVVHARAEHLQSPLMGQRVVDAHQDALAAERLEQTEHGQPHVVQRPACLGEEAVERCVVPPRRHPGRQQHAGHRATMGERPARGDDLKVVKRGTGHGNGQLLQQNGKRANKVHVSLLIDEV